MAVFQHTVITWGRITAVILAECDIYIIFLFSSFQKIQLCLRQNFHLIFAADKVLSKVSVYQGDNSVSKEFEINEKWCDEMWCVKKKKNQGKYHFRTIFLFCGISKL